VAHARIVGSSTYRRKARLDGRHTSVSGRSVAAVRFNQIKAQHHEQCPSLPLGSKAGFHNSEGGTTTLTLRLGLWWWMAVKKRSRDGGAGSRPVTTIGLGIL
jgi:hypothetical protein